MTSKELTFYASPEHPCSYLPNRQAGMMFLDPAAHLDVQIYSELIRHGFRRSGDYVYRPRCSACSACVPVRIPVWAYQRRRRERRIWQRNEDILLHPRPPRFDPEHYDLYLRYVKTRHPGGGMDHPDPQQYLEFLSCSWANTLFYEGHVGARLVVVSVVDHLYDGLSAVYTFFDPDLAQRSLGTYSILWEIEQAKRLGVPWVYLGYWIQGCQKMRYKDRYRPLEAYLNGRWVRFGEEDLLPPS